MFSRRRFLRAAPAAIAFASALAPTSANALVVTPVRIDLRPQGAGATGTLRATNDHQRPLPVEVSYKRMLIPETGSPTYEPATGDEFLIFPPQATVAVGSSQNFRVQWTGGPIDQSEFFLFEVAQLPVQRPDTVTGIEVLYSIGAIVTIAPMRGVSNLEVATIERAEVDGGAGVRLIVANSSNMHGYVSDTRLSVRGVNADGRVLWARNIESSDLALKVGLGLIPPNGRRQLSVSIPDLPAEGASLTASLAPAPR